MNLEYDETPFRREDRPRSPARSRVYVSLRDGHLEVKLGRGYSLEDVEAVRSIRRRRWDADRRVWILPDTSQSHDALAGAFGSRLATLDRSKLPEAIPRLDRRTAADKPAPKGAPESDYLQYSEVIVDALNSELRVREYSRKTVVAYLAWSRRFLRFHAHAVDDPRTLNASHAAAFLEHLAHERLSPKSRNQAASALSFMFREVLGRDEMAEVPRARGPARVPLVLTHREVLQVLRELRGKYFLIVALLYSAGLRVEECLRLRVKDIDFDLRQILVRDGKGRKDRYVPLADRATDLLRAQIRRVAERHRNDRADGKGWAPLPGALHRKDPTAGYELRWQFIFPASTLNEDPATGNFGRWPLHATAVQREVKRAVKQSGITKRATCHTFRHAFATEALRGGCDIRTLQHVMGHKDIRTTMIYLHAVEQTGLYIRSPLDRPDDPEQPEDDTLGMPTSTELHWDLAARQWGRSRRPKDDPA